MTDAKGTWPIRLVDLISGGWSDPQPRRVPWYLWHNHVIPAWMLCAAVGAGGCAGRRLMGW